MRERGADIKDIGDRLMRNMLGMNPRGLSHISGEVILVAARFGTIRYGFPR